jgi:hypothetical protein
MRDSSFSVVEVRLVIREDCHHAARLAAELTKAPQSLQRNQGESVVGAMVCRRHAVPYGPEVSQMKAHPERLLRDATGQDNVEEAVRYIAEGLFLRPKVPTTEILHALCQTADVEHDPGLTAVRRLAREVAQSDLNTSAELLSPELVTPPSVYRDALEVLASKCPGGTLASEVSFRSVVAAQRQDENVMRTLAAVAGMTWTELATRARLPSSQLPTGPWRPELVEQAFRVIDAVVNDQIPAHLDGGFAARPIELLGDPDITVGACVGWTHIEQMRTSGVPYSALLAQRTEGGAWRAHRDRIGNRYVSRIADRFCTMLDAAGVRHFKTAKVGGNVSRSEVRSMIGGGEEQVAVITTDDAGVPEVAVCVSLANDGGSVGKTWRRLAGVPGTLTVDAAVIVAGLGWSVRNETAQLASAFGGRLCSERNMSQLAAMMSDSGSLSVEGDNECP